MEVEIGRGKKGRRAYGFDDIAIVPSRRTRDPDDVDISWTLGPYRFELPLLASAMDGVVSPGTAAELGRLGGLGVLNLEGIWSRYEDADEKLAEIASTPPDQATQLMQRIYEAPVQPELIARRIEEIKEAGAVAAGSLTPQRVAQYYEVALEAGPPESTSAAVAGLTTPSIAEARSGRSNRYGPSAQEMSTSSGSRVRRDGTIAISSNP